MPPDDHPVCPCLPKGTSLPKHCPELNTCPLGIEHPPTGTEFALGCGICRQVRSF